MTHVHPEVFLEPVSSCGATGPGRILVPLACVSALGDALNDILAHPVTIAKICSDRPTVAAAPALPDADRRRAERGRLGLAEERTRYAGLVLRDELYPAEPAVRSAFSH